MADLAPASSLALCAALNCARDAFASHDHFDGFGAPAPERRSDIAATVIAMRSPRLAKLSAPRALSVPDGRAQKNRRGHKPGCKLLKTLNPRPTKAAPLPGLTSSVRNAPDRHRHRSPARR